MFAIEQLEKHVMSSMQSFLCELMEIIIHLMVLVFNRVETKIP